MLPTEAIGILSCYYEIGEVRQNDAMDMAIKALEKQEPKEPVYNPLRNGLITTAYECPTCKCRRLGHGFDLDKCYCPECGQKLNWKYIDVRRRREEGLIANP
jgi:uncharacterized Zn finger protein (UPF0148 family)